MSWFSKKTFESVKDNIASSNYKKSLNAFDLVLLGLGSVIGAGIFVVTGIVAAKYSGPAVMLSYVIAGITCIFVALSYTELITMLPTSGSVYSYSYVAYGKLFAWMIAFGVLVLEFCISCAAVSGGWSGYMNGILTAAGMPLPVYLVKGYFDGGGINILAIFVILFGGFIVYRGNKSSKMLSALLVSIKIGAILIFITIAVPHFDQKNWQEFMPFGFGNVLLGSSILFFAFKGFANIASTVEECKNPERDMVIGIIGSLVLVMIIYVTIAGLATGIVPYKLLDNAQPLAYALSANGSKLGSIIVAIGAISGMTTVVMMNIYTISRIFYVIARDGLLPKQLARLHPKHGTPHIIVMIVVFLVIVLAGLFPLQILAQVASMATLIDYIVVCSIVLLFRFTMPNVHRPFKCPAIFVIAPTALVATIYLLSKQIVSTEGNLLVTGKILITWLLIVFGLYILKAIFIREDIA